MAAGSCCGSGAAEMTPFTKLSLYLVGRGEAHCLPWMDVLRVSTSSTTAKSWQRKAMKRSGKRCFACWPRKKPNWPR